MPAKSTLGGSVIFLVLAYFIFGLEIGRRAARSFIPTIVESVDVISCGIIVLMALVFWPLIVITWILGKWVTK